MSALLPKVRTYAIVVILILALVGAQSAASLSSASRPGTDTGQVLGKTTFAFLGGLRTFVAAVLWNRLEPIFHGYYEDKPLREQRYALPTMRMVTLLDPQFTVAYYVASFNIAKSGDAEEGLAIARDGLAKNPESGLLVANLAQVLMLEDKDKNLPEMVELAERGIGPGTRWASANDAFEGLVIFRTVFKLAGDHESVARVQAAISKLEASGEIAEDHDHDGDGVQDH